jgi:hypothetical protein
MDGRHPRPGPLALHPARTPQALFKRLFIYDDQDTATSELAEPFAILLGNQLATRLKPPSPQTRRRSQWAMPTRRSMVRQVRPLRASDGP